MIRATLLAVLIAVGTSLPSKAETPLLIFAAASMTNAVQEVANAFEAAGHGPTITVFDSTSRAARQIQQGAPAHVFISANSQWAEWLVTCGIGNKASRRAIAGNNLVLIGDRPEEDGALASGKMSFGPMHPGLTRGRLAIADPIGVPAGVYAREALMAVNAWQLVQDRLVQGDTVRTVLNWVRTGTAPAGIVYATDAAIVDDVHVLATIPDTLHGPIVYEALAVSGVTSKASDFLTFLSSLEGRAILKSHGFATPPDVIPSDVSQPPAQCG
ncbi:MAG: molybdate ABC transporter substrate-binding protein [Pseudomonadota bacterium]